MKQYPQITSYEYDWEMTRELVTTIMLDETRVDYDSEDGKKKKEGTEVSMEELVSKMM